MSMIVFCQSDMDLKRYGLKSVYEVSMLYAREIVKELEFTGRIWSNSTFCILYDESYTNMCPYIQNQKFIDTPVYYFMVEMLNICEKIAIFHCEPLTDKTDWRIFHDEKSFLEALEHTLREENYSDAYNITLVFNKCTS